MTAEAIPRVVFDTNTVISALVITTSRMAWLRSHWRGGGCIPLTSQATVKELTRVLAYSKLQLSAERCMELLSDYLPYCTGIEISDTCPVICRDPKDQAFLDLAHCGKADVLVTGDGDLLALASQTPFIIEAPADYRQRSQRAESES